MVWTVAQYILYIFYSSFDLNVFIKHVQCARELECIQSPVVQEA